MNSEIRSSKFEKICMLFRMVLFQKGLIFKDSREHPKMISTQADKTIDFQV